MTCAYALSIGQLDHKINLQEIHVVPEVLYFQIYQVLLVLLSVHLYPLHRRFRVGPKIITMY